jgi:enoyl-CoA hydratase
LDEPDLPVLYERRNHVALITLNRPAARNAVNRAMAEAMEAALDCVEDDDEVRVGVLRAVVSGERPVFCSGQDLKSFGTPEGNAMRRCGGFAGLAFRQRTKPLLAAVDGLATAGGVELVLACDLAIATRRSAFALAEVTRGLMAGSGGIYRLARAVGQSVAMRSVLTGDTLGAERAYALGLIAEIVDPSELDDTALALAERIADNAPLAVAASRSMVLAAVDNTDEAALQATSDELLVRLMASEDADEGVRAFRERRPPRWSGR